MTGQFPYPIAVIQQTGIWLPSHADVTKDMRVVFHPHGYDKAG